MGEKPIWANALRRCLTRASLSGEAVTAILGRFDTSVRNGATCEASFAELCENYGNEDTQSAVAEVKSYIHTQLEQLNQSKRVESNPIVRTRQAIERFNANLSKVSGVELVGIDMANLLPHQQEAVERAREQGRNLSIKVPECLKQRTYESIAKVGGKTFKLELDIKP